MLLLYDWKYPTFGIFSGGIKLLGIHKGVLKDWHVAEKIKKCRSVLLLCQFFII